MSDILDGFMQGLLLAVVLVQFFVIAFLYFGIPSLIMDILDEYLGGGKRSSGKRAVEGMAGLTQNPLIKAGIQMLAPSASNQPPSATQAPGMAHAGGYLKGLVRR